MEWVIVVQHQLSNFTAIFVCGEHNTFGSFSQTKTQILLLLWIVLCLHAFIIKHLIPYLQDVCQNIHSFTGSQFMREQVHFKWDNDEVRVVLNQHTELDFLTEATVHEILLLLWIVLCLHAFIIKNVIPYLQDVCQNIHSFTGSQFMFS
jgi:5'(3')-deoxyribonucleotidase